MSEIVGDQEGLMTSTSAGTGPVAGPGPAFFDPHEPSDHSTVWLIRHGETEWSKSGQHTGRTDLDLTEHGVEQALALKPLLATIKPTLVLASPRRRAQRTAELGGMAVDAIDPDLSEWDYGDYEGLTSSQIEKLDPGWTIWRGNVPGGETSEQVTERADRLLARVAAALVDGPVVLFGHGHINRAIAVRWVGLDLSFGSAFSLGTAAPCLLGVEHSRPVIVRWNMTNPAAV
jgi:broad specificity phosphatase PhoE